MEYVSLFESEAFTVLDCREDRSIPLREMAPGAFLANDWRWAASGSGPRKTAERLSKLPKKFKMTVLMHAGNHNTGSSLFKSFRNILTKSPDHINVVLANNISIEERHIPLTPWMALHRVTHCLLSQARDPGGEKSSYLQCMTNAFNSVGGSAKEVDMGWGIEKEFKNFFRVILTTRCAREKNITNELDCPSEIFAQHYLGGVKFLRTKDWEARYPECNPEFRGPIDFGRKCDYHYSEWTTLRKMISNPVETDKMLENLENLVSKDVDRMSDAMVGAITSF